MLINLITAAIVREVAISERMKVYEASFNFEIENAPEYGYFYDIINFVSDRDKIKIVLQDGSEQKFEFSKDALNEEAYKLFIDNTLSDEIINVKLRIDKRIADNHFSIYSFDDFVADILNLSIEEVMIAFSGLLKDASTYLIFDVYQPVKMFATKTMFFVPYEGGNINIDFNRTYRIQSCKEVSYFYNFDIYEILPDDFKITVDYEKNPLSKLFQKIMVLLSVSFIATSSTINKNQLQGVINGQRTVEYTCDINSLPDNNVLYGIYNWIYTDGSSIDKAIIARNVISLHCKYVSIVEIDEKVMASIQSNYNLYLKNNVKEYLELKNKIAEFITEMATKTGEYATGLLDKFKTNLIAIFGFLFSVILANIVSSQPLDNIFTKEITILIEFVLIGSFIYLFICFFQSRYEIQKVYDSYEQLKQNYKDILSEDDLLEIFGQDEILNKMKRSIQKSERVYMSIWIFFLVGTFIGVEYVSSSPNLQVIFEYVRGLIQKQICQSK